MVMIHEVVDPHRLVVCLAEFMLCGHDAANGRLEPLVVGSVVVKPNCIEVVRVFKLPHGREGDVHHSVNVVISLLHFGVQDADHFKTEPVEADVLC
jgi:hypothetical protein